MATTNPALAISALNAMGDAGISFALLHGLDRLITGDVSDVDLVVSEPGDVIVRRARASWRRNGLLPVVLWPYDIGGTATVFLATEDAREGVQVDLLFDPNGRGRYGVKSGPLLDSVDSSLTPSIGEEEQLVYLWCKRATKGQDGRLHQLHERARERDRHVLVNASIAITGSSSVANDLLNGSFSARPPKRRHPFVRAVWAWQRVLTPSGFWAHVASRELADEVASRFARFLVHGVAQRVPQPGRQTVWWARSVQKVRLRPGLLVSYGPAPRLQQPDLNVTSAHVDGAVQQITVAMSARIL